MDAAVREVERDVSARGLRILSDNRDILDQAASHLLEVEMLGGAALQELASIRHGEYLFKRPEPGYEVGLDLFRKLK